MRYKTCTTGVAALLHADGRFTYSGVEGAYFCFDGEPGLTGVITEWVDLYTYFARGFCKKTARKAN